MSKFLTVVHGCLMLKGDCFVPRNNKVVNGVLTYYYYYYKFKILRILLFCEF